MLSQKPYMLRALYDWCKDNDFTPYLTTKVDKNTIVPMNYVTNEQIVLNIHHNATKNLKITKDWLSFEASFNGVVHEILIPIANIIALFSKENGHGMQFNVEPYDPNTPKPDNTNVSFGGLRLHK